MPMKLRSYSGAIYDNKELLNMFSAILDGWWTGGKYTAEFERRFAELLRE